MDTRSGIGRWPRASITPATACRRRPRPWQGGRNGSRGRGWQGELPQVAAASGLAVPVCHLPPGPSTWHTLEQRRFAQISLHWRARPLVSHELIGEWIGATTTASGRRVQAALEPGPDPTTGQVADDERARVHLAPPTCHGEWTDTISPRPADDRYTLFMPGS